jgi:hypothetical protein
MAAKWADYLISKVRYNEGETHIEAVLVHADTGDTVGGGEERSRQWVVGLLEDDSSFMTIYRTTEGRWKRGAEVRAITIGGVKYIRTDADRTEKDNLGRLPQF